jgi:predicted ATP-dependent serine protease
MTAEERDFLRKVLQRFGTRQVLSFVADESERTAKLRAESFLTAGEEPLHMFAATRLRTIVQKMNEMVAELPNRKIPEDE